MDQPNIIFIITDQQRYDTIRALGFDHMDTPHLDRLVREGVHFENCFISAASCAPARASLFTGLYPHTTGILKNADRWTRSWIEGLNQAGYHCTNIGKMHTWPFETPLGFDQRFVVENKDRYLEGRYYLDEWDKALRARGLVKQQRELYRQQPDYRKRLGAFEWKLPEDTHPDFFVGDLAVWWIRNYPRKDPLFLQIGFPGPHPPYDPIYRFAAPYLRKKLPLLPVSDEELREQPEPFKGMRIHNTEVDHDSVVHLLEPTEEQRHRQRAYYAANVTMIDEKIGEIMVALRERGYLENGIVIFTSDHGDCLTDHGHSQKWTMYDLVTRVPLIVWAPKRFPRGKVVEALCQQMDIGPAILELAGAAPPQPIEALSLKPALESDSFEGRPFVYAEQSGDGNFTTSQFMTMVRDRHWKLVHFLDEPWGQLFDLRSDPDELRNLWSSAEARPEKERLLAELREWNIRSQLATAEWSRAWR